MGHFLISRLFFLIILDPRMQWRPQPRGGVTLYSHFVRLVLTIGCG
jgi:hypothetical protein